MAGRAFGALMGLRDAFVFPLSPPFAHPRAGHGHGFQASACKTAPARAAKPCWPRATSCWAWPPKSPVLAGVRPDGLEDAPQLKLDIDRERMTQVGPGL